MLLEILIFMFLGIVLGIITGLVPGFHPNTIFAILLSLPLLFVGVPIIYLLTFVVSISITTTIVDFIPSLLFGAPDPETSLSVLPGHKLLLEGKGYEALILTVMGGVGVTILTVLTLPLALFFLPLLYVSIKSYIHIILVVFSIFLILGETGVKKLYSMLIFFLSGIFGVIVLNSISSEVSVFAGLTGLFGLSGIVSSYLTNTILPKQITNFSVKLRKKGIFIGWLAGLLSGVLPGLGSAQSGIIAAKVLKSDPKDFLVALGGINTANVLFTFIVLFTLDKTRSGAAWFVSQVTSLMINDIVLIAVVALASTLIAGFITIKIGKTITQKLGSFNYKRVNAIILVFILGLTLLFGGFFGMFISLVGMFIGLLAISLKIRKSQLMAFLLLPTILYFSGLNSLLMIILF